MVNQRRRYITWVEGQPHPETLGSSHLSAILGSGDFFARKVDPVESAQLMDRLDAAQREASGR